ncbi:metal-dependent transcriptional regulator, partial [bacterium]|nr:metal-dependent transcriptional regulator [bacterium]
MLTSGLQDYLEVIYNKISNSEQVKAIDIANIFNVSRPSVSEALFRLSKMELIKYEPRKPIQITKLGVKEAKKVTKKHAILFEFFNQVLGLKEEISNSNACKIEHVIDDEIIQK